LFVLIEEGTDRAIIEGVGSIVSETRPSVLGGMIERINLLDANGIVIPGADNIDLCKTKLTPLPRQEEL
jgi:hypothetical protein